MVLSASVTSNLARECQHGNQSHIIFSRDNGITKFRFSVCRASPHIHSHAQRQHLTAVENDGHRCESSYQARFRNSADGPVCQLLCADTSRTKSTVAAQLSLVARHWPHEHDVEEILRRPILHRCWRSVNLCE